MLENNIKSSFKINQHKIGTGYPCFVIAEIGQAHDGSLGTAHAYIDAVAKTGVQAIKFQTHIADAESSPAEKFRVNVFPQDENRYEYWKRMEFTEAQWVGLMEHANEKNLVFLSSPFSFQAVELLERIGIQAWKIGSGEIGNTPMLQKIGATKKPVLLSSGMSYWDEIDQAIATISDLHGHLGVFQCTTSYPCPADKIGLNVIREIIDRYGCPAGLSDHSGTIYPNLAAVALGASMIEVHVVLSKDSFGPDVSSSITISELCNLVEGIRFNEKALSSNIDKNVEANGMNELRELFGKSIYFLHDLKQGHEIGLSDISIKKPGTGIPANKLKNYIGRKLTKACYGGEQLKEDDLL
jgi:N-acetylneuraminate synthase